VTILGQTGPGGIFLTWSPLRADIRLVDPGAATAAVAVTIRARSTASGGDLVFGTSATSTTAGDVSLTVPLDGSPTSFFVAGRVGRPSSAASDVAIEVIATGSGRTR
jgi:hypothetical protein